MYRISSYVKCNARMSERDIRLHVALCTSYSDRHTAQGG